MQWRASRILFWFARILRASVLLVFRTRLGDEIPQIIREPVRNELDLRPAQSPTAQAGRAARQHGRCCGGHRSSGRPAGPPGPTGPGAAPPPPEHPRTRAPIRRPVPAIADRETLPRQICPPPPSPPPPRLARGEPAGRGGGDRGGLPPALAAAPVESCGRASPGGGRGPAGALDDARTARRSRARARAAAPGRISVVEGGDPRGRGRAGG